MGSHILKDLTHKMKGQHPLPPQKEGVDRWVLGKYININININIYIYLYKHGQRYRID